jgi:hypothetical protein
MQEEICVSNRPKEMTPEKLKYLFMNIAVHPYIGLSLGDRDA